MIKIYQHRKQGYEDTIRKAALAAVSHFGIKEEDVGIEINTVTAEQIKALNNSYRGKDCETDVLSFASAPFALPLDKNNYPDMLNPEDGSIMLGEIFICTTKAAQQAKEYGHSVEREISFLTCHGVLHLLGFDHEEESGEKVMQELQDKILDEELGVARDATKEPSAFKSGFVAIMGRPNSGKSTLTNNIVGEKVSIVSWKPQTTRDKILGIYNDENTQIVLIDTPGLHTPKNSLGKYMMKTARTALEGVDAVVYLIDAEKGVDGKDKQNIVSYVENGLNTILAVNKIDHVTKEKVFSILTELKDVEGIKAIVPISALKGKNVDIILNEIKSLLTDTTKFYPDDMFTDKNLRFMTAEIIREKALRLLDKEVPYGIGVDITRYEIRQNGIIDIDADIICEKAAHKPIILGKGGSMIKKIATFARQDIETMTGSKVFLTVFVLVKEDWRGSDNIMKGLGYDLKT
ncbi:MAG: GTPase Era [Clostridia bacterium]|nr:GTPase Era [Clostridia bacterium]